MISKSASPLFLALLASRRSWREFRYHRRENPSHFEKNKEALASHSRTHGLQTRATNGHFIADRVSTAVLLAINHF